MLHRQGSQERTRRNKAEQGLKRTLGPTADPNEPTRKDRRPASTHRSNGQHEAAVWCRPRQFDLNVGRDPGADRSKVAGNPRRSDGIRDGPASKSSPGERLETCKRRLTPRTSMEQTTNSTLTWKGRSHLQASKWKAKRLNSQLQNIAEEDDATIAKHGAENVLKRNWAAATPTCGYNRQGPNNAPKMWRSTSAPEDGTCLRSKDFFIKDQRIPAYFWTALTEPTTPTPRPGTRWFADSQVNVLIDESQPARPKHHDGTTATADDNPAHAAPPQHNRQHSRLKRT